MEDLIRLVAAALAMVAKIGDGDGDGYGSVDGYGYGDGNCHGHGVLISPLKYSLGFWTAYRGVCVLHRVSSTQSTLALLKAAVLLHPLSISCVQHMASLVGT